MAPLPSFRRPPVAEVAIAAQFGEIRGLTGLDEQLGEPSLNQWELTYVNHIPAGDGWHRHGELGSVVPLLVGSMQGEYLPEPEDIALRVRYAIPDKHGAVSRLHVVADPGFDSSGKPGIVLTLTARGGLGRGSEDSIESRLDLGREWIVRGFVDVTSEAMHRHWEREQ